MNGVEAALRQVIVINPGENNVDISAPSSKVWWKGVSRIVWESETLSDLSPCLDMALLFA